MFKKLNYKVLLILLVVLLGIYLIAEYSGSDERTFKSEIVSIDTASITEVVINNPEHGKIVLSKTGPGWQMQAGKKKYPVDPSAMNSLFIPLTGMKSDGVAAISEEKHASLKVDDTTGVRVIVKDGNKTLADFYVGNLSFQQPSNAAASQQAMQFQQQQQGKMITYIREADDETVYGVEGFLRSTFGRKADDFRNKTLVSLNKDDVTQMAFNYANDESFTLSKKSGKWILNGQEADSTKTVRFIQKLSRQRGREFADDFDISGLDVVASLRIEGNNFSPILVNAYPADSAREYIITSSLNPDAKLSGAKGVYTRLFEEKSHFLK